MLPSEMALWAAENVNSTENGEKSHYVTPPYDEPLSSTFHNSLGLHVIRTWPTIYNSTESSHGLPDWWNPQTKVDMLICDGTRLEL